MRPPLLHDGLLSLPDYASTRPLLRHVEAIGLRLGRAIDLLSTTRTAAIEKASPRANPVAAAGPVLSHARRVRQPADHGIREDLREAANRDDAEDGAPDPVPDSPARVAPVVATPTPRRQLVRATDEYVSEPHEPATPYRSSDFLRMVRSAKAPWESDDEEQIAPLPPPAERAAARRTGAASGDDGSRQTPPTGRASLGMSRRLGLRPPVTGRSASGEPASGELASGEPDSGPPVAAADASGSADASGPATDTAASSGAAATRAEDGAASRDLPQQRRRADGDTPAAARPAADGPAASGGPVSAGPVSAGPVSAGRASGAAVPAGRERPGAAETLPPAEEPATAEVPPASGTGSGQSRVDRPRAEPVKWWAKNNLTHANPSAPRDVKPADTVAAGSEGGGDGFQAVEPHAGGRGETVQPATRAAETASGGADGGAAAESSTTSGRSPRATPAAAPRPDTAAAPGPNTAAAPRPDTAAARGRDTRGADPGVVRGLQEMSVSGQQGNAPAMPTRRHAPGRPVPGGREPHAAPSRDEAASGEEMPSGNEALSWEEPPALGATASPGMGRLPGVAGPLDSAEGDASFPHVDQGAVGAQDAEDIAGSANAPAGRLRQARDPAVAPAPGVRYQSALDPLLPAPPRRPASPVRGAPAALDPTAAVQRPLAVQRPPAAQDRVAAQPDRPATGDQLTEKVPAGLAGAFRALHGADVSDVPVRRGRAVARQAARLDAAAFSRDGVVYLPDAAGSLNQAGAEALLAHELTHVAQQRMLGSALPSEASPEGRALEEQALATQQWFLGGTGAVPPLALLSGAGAAQPARPPVMRHLHLAPAESASESSATSSASSSASPSAEPGVQRQPVDTAAPVVTGSEGLAGVGWIGSPSRPADYPVSDAANMTEEAGVPEVISEAIADTQAGIAQLRMHIGELADQRLLDMDNPVELDELATRIYGRLRSKLRLELIVDRERAGLLTDFR